MAANQQTHGSDGDHHGHPAPPDESKLWDDRAHGANSDDIARMWFRITIGGAAAYITAVIVWIFL